MILPQAAPWVKKEADTNSNQNTHTQRSQNQTNNQNQNQNQSVPNGNNPNNINQNITNNNNNNQRDHNPLKERNNPRERERETLTTGDPGSFQTFQQAPSRTSNNTAVRSTPHNSNSQPQPNSFHQHHQHHQHQAPPVETELSRFPPYDATYISSNRQTSVPTSNTLPHQAVQQSALSLSSQQSLMKQQKQQHNQNQNSDFDCFPSNSDSSSDPLSPNPAPHKSSKPNSSSTSNSFIRTASGVSNQNQQNLQNTINTNNINNMTDMNNGSNSIQTYNQFINNSSSLTYDNDEAESENCPATRVPEWCQEIKISTPLSDHTSGASSTYSGNNSPFDQDQDKE